MARIIVGECSSCNHPLRVKTTGVKGTLNLTCRCGTCTRIEVTPELRSAALKEEQKPLSSQQSIRPDRSGSKNSKTDWSGLKKRLYNCRWILVFFIMYGLGLGGFMLLGKLGMFDNTNGVPSVLFIISIMFTCIGLLGCTISAYYYALTLDRDGGWWGLFVFLFIFIAPLILVIMPASGSRFSSLYKSDTGSTGNQMMDLRKSCMGCSRKVEGRDALMSSQAIAIQAGLTQRARDMEKNQGYMCLNCNNVYCKGCLEGRVINPQTGASCPNCGGSCGYLP